MPSASSPASSGRRRCATGREGAMKGLRVADFSSSLAGAYCSRLFATTGADVVCVEPAGGSPLRRAAPRLGERSALWEYLAAGKRSVTFGRDDPRVDDLL